MQAKIWNYSGWINDTEPKRLKNEFTSLLKRAGFTVLRQTEHTFDPQGFTSLWLLAESHFAVHTFPEEGAAYFELSSCNEGKLYEFMDLLPLSFDVLIKDPENLLETFGREETEEPEKAEKEKAITSDMPEVQ